MRRTWLHGSVSEDRSRVAREVANNRGWRDLSPALDAAGLWQLWRGPFQPEPGRAKRRRQGAHARTPPDTCALQVTSRGGCDPRRGDKEHPPTQGVVQQGQPLYERLSTRTACDAAKRVGSRVKGGASCRLGQRAGRHAARLKRLPPAIRRRSAVQLRRPMGMSGDGMAARLSTGWVPACGPDDCSSAAAKRGRTRRQGGCPGVFRRAVI